ncbi:unnamed protein product [Brachionus calyciflorus]|uniref:N-acetyltransferase domain-containing protein n=1 Tax=Brachionus calyciflorus TaxID=104777 RepID=A0A813MR70_9BILA|nr:unnamed protein product [Brachionus calyciflorus]
MANSEFKYEIRRTFFDNHETLKCVQNLFMSSYSKLLKHIICISIRHVFTQLSNFLFLILLVIVTSVLNEFFLHYTIWQVVLLSAIFFGICTILYIIFYMYQSWTSWFDEIINESDLCYKNANKVYSKEKNAFFVAVTPENKIIGCAGILLDEEKNIFTDPIVSILDENEALLIRVITLPEYQGKGIAKLCVSACIDFAKQNNINTIQLVSTNRQNAAVKLYEGIGFVNIRNELFNKFLDYSTVLMELNL